MSDRTPAEDAEPPFFRYRAFISYSHKDKAAASRIHREVEAYRVPKRLVGTRTFVGVVPRRLAPLFRDRDELPASADLGSELSEALRLSMFLIVVCTPASAKSHWVDEEVLQFKQLRGEDRVLAVIASGTPFASDTPGKEHEECFPRSLRFRLGADGALSDTPAEVIAADIRSSSGGWRLAKLKLIAGLTGVRLADLVQREAQRRYRQMAAIASGALAGMVVTGGLAFYANALRIEANEQRVIAQREAAAARAASDYLVGTFELSNPATENPRTITALTILGRSAERARTELADQPAIQARLLATLGRAYNNLGLFNEARTALEDSLPSIRKSDVDGADALLVLATTYREQGALDKAMATVRQAEALLGPDQARHAVLRGDAALAEGRILTSASKVREAVAAFDRSIAFYKVSDVPPKKLAIALNNRGLVLSDDGQFDAADKSLHEALAIWQRALGERHVYTGQAWYALAYNSFNAGKLPQAEVQIANALKIEQAVLDADNPTIANTLTVQGQILDGVGKLPEAEASLKQAIAIYRKAFGKPHFLIGIADVYLGLIESKLGDTAGALATLDDAKHNYDVGYGKLHPNHGDLLVNRAKVLARAGRMREAHADCDAGVAILRQTLGAEASFTKSSAAVCPVLAPLDGGGAHVSG
jgi:tetratricopeptide (TPR) repeat protein